VNSGIFELANLIVGSSWRRKEKKLRRPRSEGAFDDFSSHEIASFIRDHYFLPHT